MKLKILSLVFHLLYLPFYLYLIYLILRQINASELMWFLFWLLLPMAFVCSALSEIAEWEEK